MRRSSPCRRCPDRVACSTGCAHCSSVAERRRSRGPFTPLPPPHALMNAAFTTALRELAATAERVERELGAELDRALEMVRAAVAVRGTLFFCGNGGSAADAQHMATEYVVRYMRNRRAYPAIALTTDTSLLTAAGNDIGFENVFARQVEALAKRGDLL